ncbi:hypothetical protein HMPREF1870_01760 [Bacteroidales bacterium KA00344]|nr:hypothetical protein HMPREF1870_01760 [Bacteroidales bacterium KA00344]
MQEPHIIYNIKAQLYTIFSENKQPKIIIFLFLFFRCQALFH